MVAGVMGLGRSRGSMLSGSGTGTLRHKSRGSWVRGSSMNRLRSS